MNCEQVRKEHFNVLHALFSEGFAVEINQPIIQRSGDSIFVTWSTSSTGQNPLYTEATLNEYERLVRERQYSALLFDNSIIQMSVEFQERQLKKVRLVYFPCPIESFHIDMSELSILDYLEMTNEKDFRKDITLNGPLRFDYDETAKSDNHPAAHFTIIRNTCRIPTYAPISCGHFLHFIIEQFYPNWQHRTAISAIPCTHNDRVIKDIHLRKMHFNCLRP